jgi:hypothetical protein
MLNAHLDEKDHVQNNPFDVEECMLNLSKINVWDKHLSKTSPSDLYPWVALRGCFDAGIWNSVFTKPRTRPKSLTHTKCALVERP